MHCVDLVIAFGNYAELNESIILSLSKEKGVFKSETIISKLIWPFETKDGLAWIKLIPSIDDAQFADKFNRQKGN